MSKSDNEWALISLKKRVSDWLTDPWKVGGVATALAWLKTMVVGAEWIKFTPGTLALWLVIYGLLVILFQGLLLWEQPMVNTVIQEEYRSR